MYNRLNTTICVLMMTGYVGALRNSLNGKVVGIVHSIFNPCEQYSPGRMSVCLAADTSTRCRISLDEKLNFIVIKVFFYAAAAAE